MLQLVITLMITIQFAILFINLFYIYRSKKRADPCVLPVSLSILIPARNERDRLPMLLETLCGHGIDEGIEIWVCDDQSTDGTREWLSEHAERYGVRWFVGAELPPGWIGKNWACFQLAQRATGEWLLFIDSDLTFRPRVLEWITDLLRCTDAMLVTALPSLDSPSLGVRLLKAMLPFSILTLLPLPLAEKSPNPAFAFANGQFLAIRKRDYDSLQPHLQLRGQVLEDVAFAALVKRAGGRVWIVSARDQIKAVMYTTLAEAVRGFAKNAVAICRSVPKALIVMFLLGLVYGWPIIGLLMGNWSSLWHWWAVGQSILLFGLAQRVVGLAWYHALLYPISVAVGIWTLGYSIWWYRCGVIEWKDRSYRLDSTGSPPR